MLLSGILVFSPLLQGGTTYLAIMIDQVMIMALLGIYLWSGIRARLFIVPSMRISIPVLLYLILGAISVINSAYIQQSAQWLMVLLGYAVLLFLFLFFVVQWSHIIRLITTLVIMGVLEAIYALIQGWISNTRPTGTFFNPNFLAGYLVAIWLVMLGILTYAWMGRRSFRGNSSLAAIRAIGGSLILVVLLLAIIWTGSRGAALSFVMGTTLIVIARFGRKGLGVLVFVLMVALLIPSPLHDRIYGEHFRNPLSYARWQIWQSSVKEIMDHPLGIGLGLYQYVYPRYATPMEGQIARYGNVAQTAHNEYLQMGVELGIVSVFVFGWGVILVVNEATHVLRRRLQRWQRGIIVGTSAAVFSLLVHAAIDSNLREPALAIILTILVGTIFSVSYLSARGAQSIRAFPVRYRFLWSSLAGMVIAVLVISSIRLGVGGQAFEAGSHALSAQDFKRAVSAYQIAIAMNPGKALYHNSLAATYFQIFKQTGDRMACQVALDELEFAIKLNPLDGRLSGLLGHVYTTLAFSQTLPPISSDFSNEQRTLFQLSAVSAYERALELEPFSPFYRLELGQLYLALGSREAAEATIHKTIALEPNFLPARAWLVTFYLKSDKIEAAFEEYREILQRQQKYVTWNKDSLEFRFLTVDLTTLKAVLGINSEI